MPIPEVLQPFSTNIIISLPGIVLFIVFAVHFIPYIADQNGLRAYPGPFFAKFTDVWLALAASRRRRSEEIHRLHQKHGAFVRLAPNHISISPPAALNKVYGHSSGTLKSDFYDAFVTFKPGLFAARSRTVHTRKRRIVAHMFAAQNVRSFEPTIRQYVGELCARWDKLCENVAGNKQKGPLGAPASSTEGRVWFDCVPWLNYCTFDIIGRLAFGKAFGMLHSGRDAIKVVKSINAGMDAYGASAEPQYETTEVSAISILAKRTEIVIILGFLPKYWRSFIVRLPYFSQGTTTLRQLKGMAIAAVAGRLAASVVGDGEIEKQDDMLQRLLDGRDEEGKPMAPPELSTEALTLIITGSDTVANSAAAIIYYISRDLRVKEKLQAELDAALGVYTDYAAHDAVKHLPYLNAVINEALRLYSPVGGGLPRVVPEGGITVFGQTFKEGTILSVPVYTLHRDTDIWGADAEDFRPERWLEGDSKELHTAFAPFSVGPRACIGRNLAELEMLVIIATIYHRYDVALQPALKLNELDAFIRKVENCTVGIKRRHV